MYIVIFGSLNKLESYKIIIQSGITLVLLFLRPTCIAFVSHYVMNIQRFLTNRKIKVLEPLKYKFSCKTVDLLSRAMTKVNKDKLK